MATHYDTFALVSAIYDVDRIRIRVFATAALKENYPCMPDSWYLYINSIHWKSAAYLSRVSATLQIGFVLSLSIRLSPRQEWAVVPGKVIQHPVHWVRQTLATVVAKQKFSVRVMWPYKESANKGPITLPLQDFPQLQTATVGQLLQVIASDRSENLPDSIAPLAIIPPVVVLQVKFHNIQYTPFEDLEDHLAYWENLIQVSLSHEAFVTKKTIRQPETYQFTWAQNGNPFQLQLSPLQNGTSNVKANSPYTVSVGDARVGAGTVSRPQASTNNQNLLLTLPTDTLLSFLTNQTTEGLGRCILSAADNNSTFSVASKVCKHLFAINEKVALPNVFHMPIWKQLIGFKDNPVALAAPTQFRLDTPTQGTICLTPYRDIAYHVLHGSHVNPLSIIFGPPGAGKTTLLVAMIYHVVLQTPTDQVLVTAMTNTAIDNILEKLLPIIAESPASVRNQFKIVRMLPQSRDEEASTAPFALLHLALQPYSGRTPETEILIADYHRIIRQSTTIGKAIHHPPEFDETRSSELREVNKSRVKTQKAIEEAYLAAVKPNVIFATVITAHNPRLHSPRYNLSPQSIFVDEACQVNIPLTLTVLQLLCPKQEKRVVLTGDVMQLAAVTMSKGQISEFLSFSLAEYLTMPGKVTPFELNITYRSHPNLLRFPAAHFYPKGLYSGTAPAEREDILRKFPFPNPEFPILFVSHEYPEAQDRQMSKSNSLERRCIVQLYTLLRVQLKVPMEDIGIISFYNSQVNKILQDLQAAGFKDVPYDSVATAEKFQGKEKSVILISCVRSSQVDIRTPQQARRYLGFLDTRRLVSTITRARSAMFIVGNSRHLSYHSFWHKYVDFCLQHHLIISEKQFQQMYAKLVPSADPFDWTRNAL